MNSKKLINKLDGPYNKAHNYLAQFSSVSQNGGISIKVLVGGELRYVEDVADGIMEIFRSYPDIREALANRD